ncbi:hypothetical protein [Thermococcus sp. 5-4]|uniref:hypothetical protein n=1 Tax=Thermococcus sp. 5-4 TaxID=2008440 RepID=UPI000B49B8FE|nr:hypothetical protein [Thermococcus sp. 5-4]ASA77118.1 hypothetical protein CDI07_02010 [Thermococcus sp. 5-4]
MEGKKGLILAVAPFVIFMVLGSIFVGTYYRERSLAREQVAAMDKLEKVGEENASWSGLCNIVEVYVTVRDREDAARLEEFLREEKIRVAVSRHGERFISMMGRIALKDVEGIVEKGRENGWVAAYHNNSDFCAKRISEFELENRIISAHLDELSPESREILTGVMESNSERIEEIENEMRLWAELDIMVQAGPSYTPGSFHDLSGFLATWGVVLGTPFLLWWVFGGKQEEGKK